MTTEFSASKMRSLFSLILFYSSLTFAADWPQWRGLNRDGIAVDCPPLSWPATGPKLLWKSEHIPANLEGGFGSVAIADGRAYVFVSWQSGFKGSAGPQDVIVCLDEASGKTLWMTGFPSAKTNHCSGSTPCVAGDKVFAFGSQRLYCMDVKTGRALWQSGLTGGQISSSPLFADNMVFALSDALRAYDSKGGDPVDPDNPKSSRQPKLLWEQPKAAGGPSFEGVDHTSYNSSPAVWRKDGITYIITCGDKLTCVEAKTGEIKWQAPGPGGASATPTISGDYVVINYGQGRGTYAYRMTPEKAELLWRISKSDRGTSSVIVDGYVYAYGAGSYACYDLITGQEMWKQRFGGEISSPIVADGKVFGFYDGASAITVFKATPESFFEIDNLQTSAVVTSSPAVANGKLYLRKGNCVASYALTSDPEEQAVLPPLAAAANKPLRIIFGSTQDWFDDEGNLWSADKFANDGKSFAVGESTGQVGDLPRNYRSGRKGLTGFPLHLVDGVYTVRAHFCETDEAIAEPGLRVMTLHVNGRELKDIDPFGDTGGRGFPLVKQSTTIVKNGLLRIDLASQSGETLINALEILPGEVPEPRATERKPIPLPVAPVTAPSDRGLEMQVGVIDMPMVRYQTTGITSREWGTGLESAALADDRITVARIISLDELAGALAHPEKWLAIINPYGEAFPVAGPSRWKEMLAGIRQYVRNGGNWFETGGYPFFEGFFEEDGGFSSARIMGEGMKFLEVGVSSGPQKAPLEQLVVTALGKEVLGEDVAVAVLKVPCEINRPLPKDDPHLTVLAVEGRDYMGGYSLGGWGRFWRFGGSRISAELAIPVTAEIIHYSYTHPPLLSSQSPAPDAIGLSASGQRMSQDWPQWRGPNRDGIVPNSPPLSWSAVGPKKLWQSEALPSMEDGGFGSVCVANGKAYLLVAWKSGFEGAAERQDVIVCLDEECGKTLWKVGYPGIRTDHASSSVPCVADNKVFVCGVERLYCLDAESGALLWKTGEIGKQISSSPLFLGGMVIVSANSLFAYDATTGKELWRQDEAAGGPSFEGVPHTSNNCSPVVWRKDGVNYIINCGAKLTCVEAKTGVVKWQAPGPGGASATPAISGDYVVINYGSGRGTYAYHMTPEKAEELWRISKSDRGSTPVILDGYVYAFGGGSYACYELTTGQEKWKERFSGEISSPVAADGKVFGFYDGCAGIVVFKSAADNYTEIDRLSIQACNASTPTIAGGKLFVRAYDGVTCYALTRDAHNVQLPELAAPAGKPIRINVGGKTNWLDPDGHTWMADRFPDDGTPFEWSDLSIQDSKLAQIYQSERRGVTGYTLHVADGDYTVRAHFCENYEGIPAKGLRVMTLDINGAVLRNVDPFGETGTRGIPLVKQVHTSVTNGLLKIDLLALGSETILNGLEILPGRLPEPDAKLQPRPQPQPKAPDTSPRDRGVAMSVGIIDIPGLANTYARIKPEVWVTRLQNTKVADYGVAVKRLTTVEELVAALAHPEIWLSILNPYGEHFVAAGPGRWQEMVESIRHYVRNGGNWWEMGGYPLYQSQYSKDSEMLSERVLNKGFKFLGLDVGQSGEEGSVAITEEGNNVFDEQCAEVITKFACATHRGMPVDGDHLTLLKAGDFDLLGGYPLGGWGWFWRFVSSQQNEDLYVPAVGAVLEYLYTHEPTSLTLTAQVAVDQDFPSLEEMKRNWPRFRGVDGGSTLSMKTNTPLKWDVQSGEGVLWKVPVPASGYSSPIVWDERVFLSGGNANTRSVFCFHGANGDLLWQRNLDLPTPAGGEKWKFPESAGMASATMATDGQRAYAIFANGDLAAFDFEGNRVWARNLGLPENFYGHTASLALWENRLIVQMDQSSEDENKSRLIALDSATGQSIWEKNRPVDASWTSPIVVDAAGKNQILTLSVPWAIAYDAMDGSELWRLGGISGEVTSSPIFAAGLFFVTSPFETLYAINPDGQGDITETHVVWSSDEWVPDICTPVSNGDLLFTLMTSGLLTCYDVADGKKQWEHDFDMEFQASPAIVDNRLYLFGYTGKVLVLEVSRHIKELTSSDLAETIYASPAFAQDRIYIRSTESLFCLGGK